MSEQTMPIGVLPIRCKNAVSVRRVFDIVDGLNHLNNRFPMDALVASGPEDLLDEEVFEHERWVEVSCVSPGKLRHLMDRMDAVMPMIDSVTDCIFGRTANEEEHQEITEGGVATAGQMIGEEVPI